MKWLFALTAVGLVAAIIYISIEGRVNAQVGVGLALLAMGSAALAVILHEQGISRR